MARRLLSRLHVFRHILVAIDLGRQQRRCLDVATSLAQATGARVTVLHVIQRIAGLPAPELRAFYAGLEATAGRHVARALARLERAGVRATGRLVVGDPARDVLREATRRRADLVVLGSHRLARAPGMGLGTTSHQVALAAKQPVLLVR